MLDDASLQLFTEEFTESLEYESVCFYFDQNF